jgi:hypothetical protein
MNGKMKNENFIARDKPLWTFGRTCTPNTIIQLKSLLKERVIMEHPFS